MEPLQAHILEAPGTIFTGVKRQQRKADHTPPSKAEVKNVWSYASSPHRHILACTIVTSYVLIFTVRK